MSGRIEQIDAETTPGQGQQPTTVANISYSWDTIDNLVSRDDAFNTVPENFCYLDNAGGTANVLNRLSTYSVGGTGKDACTNGSPTTSVTYDNDGNILSKSDVGGYTYGGGGGGPHALSSIATISGVLVDGIANPTFVYDSDGNMKCVTPAGSGCSDAARNYGWTSFDMAETITQGADSETLSYDPEHSRGSLADSSTGNTTCYLNNPAAGLRSELLQGSTATWRDYMMAYGEIVAERFDTANTPSVYYFVGDHLASTTALTDVNQNEEEYDSGACAPAALRADRGDAWGKRRNVNGTEWNGCLSLHPPSATLRGYTGQEEMNSYCLVNLNARLYDPTLGRFLSADSMVPDALNGQGFNRYSYVLNNPLAMTDPSGHEDDGIFPIVCYECSSGSGGMPSDSMPCWDCTGPGLTNDIYGNPVPAANFAGGWNSYSIGWNAPNYNAPTCGGGKTSGCWTPTSGGSSSNPDGTAVTVWSSHSYWVPGSSTLTNWSGIGTAFDYTGDFVTGQELFAGAVVARFGNGASAVSALSALDKFAFGPIANTLLLGDQFMQTLNDMQNEVNPASAILGHGINGGLLIGAGALGTIGADAAWGTLIGEGPWGTVSGIAVGALNVSGVSWIMPSGQEWNQTFYSMGQTLDNEMRGLSPIPDF